jgi:hypothetical protein
VLVTCDCLGTVTQHCAFVTSAFASVSQLTGQKHKKIPWLLVSKLTKPTEHPPLVDEVSAILFG